jgi:3-dehydroquinate synthase
MKIIKINLSKNSYNIYIKQHLFANITKYIKDIAPGNFALIVTSSLVLKLYEKDIAKAFAGFPNSVIALADGEGAKTKESLFKVIQKIISEDKLGRKVFVVCLGGGTIGDVGGFAASIYKRGIPYIQVPTTLLSAIDASIGGKTAIDLKEAKNILGAFYHPRAVFIDPDFLGTLNGKQITEGIAEAVKYAVIRDQGFFNFLSANFREIISLEPSFIAKVINTCAGIKAKIVSADDMEKKGIRTVLNFGHTFGHALEAASKYKKISHGEAVAVGMLYAAYLSNQLGLCSMGELCRLRDLLKKFGLPVKHKYDFRAVYRTMHYDKKNISGKFRMVLLIKVGEVKVVDGISERLIDKTIREFNAFI